MTLIDIPARKSARSGGNDGGDCVEYGRAGGRISINHSKDRGYILRTSVAGFRALRDAIRLDDEWADLLTHDGQVASMVMTLPDVPARKSRRSAGSSDCFEFGRVDGEIIVRHSRQPDKVITFTLTEFQAMRDGIRLDDEWADLLD